MKAKELIYNIQNLRAKGVQSQSNNLSDRQIMFMIDYYRSTLVRRFLLENPSNVSMLEQDLGALELEDIDRSYIDNGNCEIKTLFETSCVKKTIKKIPNFLETYKTNVTYVGTIDLLESYQFTTYNKFIWDRYAKYTGKNTKAYLSNHYFYIEYPQTSLQKYIRVKGIFDSPFDANLITDTNLDPYDFEYPVLPYMVDMIYKMLINSELRLFASANQDKLNNSNDEQTI